MLETVDSSHNIVYFGAGGAGKAGEKYCTGELIAFNLPRDF